MNSYIMECPQEIKELMKTLYGFSPSESQVMTVLCEEDSLRVEEMAEILDKDRSTVQRYVSKLRAAGLIKRNSVTKEKGKGRYYVYHIDKEKMKEKIRNKLDSWKKEKEEELEKI